MSLDVDALADVVLHTIDTALVPVSERVARLEAKLADEHVAQDVAAVRDRMLVMETKAAAPVVSPPVDLTAALAPVMERVSKMEATLAAAPIPEPSVDPDDLVASFTGMLTKELAALDTPRTQKRVERDEHGNVTRVVEEPVTE